MVLFLSKNLSVIALTPNLAMTIRDELRTQILLPDLPRLELNVAELYSNVSSLPSGQKSRALIPRLRRIGLIFVLAMWNCVPFAYAQDPTKLVVTATNTSATSLTLAATVTDTTTPANAPTGSVKFSLGGVDLGTCPLSSGSCSQVANLSLLTPGLNTISANYIPTGSFATSNASMTAELPKISFSPAPLNIPTGSTAPVSFTLTITGTSLAPAGAVSLTAKPGKVSNAAPTCTTTGLTVSCTDTYMPDSTMTGSATYSQAIVASVAASGGFLAESQSDDVITGSSACAGCFATLGLGVSINYKHYTDYNDLTNILQSTNLGNASPQLLVGISYQTPWRGISYSKLGCKPTQFNQDVDGKLVYCYPWRVFVNAKFSTTASQTVNGFTVGTSFRLAKSLDLLMGISLNAFNEATPGFRAAAVQVTQAQQKAGNPNYTPFDIYAMQHNFRNAFDGFPTQLLQYSCTSTTPSSCTTTTGSLIYSGSPTGVQYLPGLFFGVVIPIQLKTLLGSK